jgi:hypothetical protein
MGINAQSLLLLLEEDAYKPIVGSILCLGQNTTHVKPEMILHLASVYKKHLPENLFTDHEHLDTTTKTAKRLNYPTLKQESIFHLFFPGISGFSVLDCSDYEGATIVLDLNLPLPVSEERVYDFIYDGSVLDNVFNPAQALINCHQLLAPSGRFVSVNAMNFLPGAMTSLSCEWFFSFFAQNNYSDVRSILNALPSSSDVNSYNNVFDWFEYSPRFTPTEGFDAGRASNAVYKHYSTLNVLVVAEKRDTSSTQLSFPQNLQYCFDESQVWPQKEPTQRPPTIAALNKRTPLLEHMFESDHYKYIGSF